MTVIFNSIYTAEHYDARQEIEGWNTSGIDVSQWKNAKEVSAPTQRIEAQLTVPVKEIVRHNASRFVKINDTCFVYHFPENMAGNGGTFGRGESQACFTIETWGDAEWRRYGEFSEYR